MILLVYLIRYISFDYKTSGKFNNVNAYELMLSYWTIESYAKAVV